MAVLIIVLKTIVAILWVLLIVSISLIAKTI